MVKEFLRRIAYLGRRSRFNAELDTEVQFHIDSRADELEQSGVPRRDALRQARRELGSGARLLEETRSAWQFQWIEDLVNDLRYAARALRRNPVFGLTATACLALGIGANTTVFSIAMEVLFSEPSVRDPATLVHVRVGGGSHRPVHEYRLLRAAGVFPDLAGENEETESNWRDGDRSARTYVVRVTDNFFQVAGIPIGLGRPIQPGENDTVVLTHGFWQRRLGGDPTILGRKLVLDGHPYVVAGVLPKDHRTVTGFGFAPDLYAPVRDEKTVVALYARMAPGMTRTIAAERMKAAIAEMRMDKVATVTGIGGMDRLRVNRLESFAIFFTMLMVVVGLVLLIACANVASLLLARASSRSHEIAIRLSIGAGRWRLVRQLLAESLLLAMCGVVSGLALNIATTTLLSRIRLPLPFPIQFMIKPDWRLLAYAAVLALVTCLAAGLAPAIQSTRAGIGAVLKRDSHRMTFGKWTFRNVLVAGQIAVSVVLLTAGLLFVRSLLRASTTSPGFDIDRSVWAYMRRVPDAARKPAANRAFIDGALDRLRALPGVESAAIARVVPLNNNVSTGTRVTTDLSSEPIDVGFKHNHVGPGYFHTMQIPILAGREFRDEDRAGTEKVGILNESLARRLFGNVNPVGHVVRFDWAPVRIVGVARNSKYFMMTEENEQALYEAYAQWGTVRSDLHFLIRAAGAPQPLVPAISATLGQLDATAAIETKPMSQALTFALLPSRFGAAVLGSMGFLGLALASIGLYGVLLYSVSRRTREIGLRIALGATPRRVLHLVIRQSAFLVVMGLGAGTAIALFAVRPLAMFLIPGVRPADPLNFVVAAAVLGLVALIATAAPALRALRVDPMAALRHE